MSIVWHGRYMDGREHPDITLAGNCFLKPSGGWSQALSAIPVAGLIGVLRASDRRIPIRRKSGGVVQSVNDAVCNNNTCCNNNNKKYAFNKRFCQKFKDIDKAKRERIQMEGSK